MCNKRASPPCERTNVKDVCRCLSIAGSLNGFHNCFMRSFWLLSTLYTCERWCHPNVRFSGLMMAILPKHHPVFELSLISMAVAISKGYCPGNGPSKSHLLTIYVSHRHLLCCCAFIQLWRLLVALIVLKSLWLVTNILKN